MANFDWNAYLPREGVKILTTAGVVIAALCGAGWALFSFGYMRGKDVGQDELAAYKTVNMANIPEITSAFTAINKELRESMKVFDRNKELEAQGVSYQKQLTEAAAARAAAEADVQSTRRELNAAKDVEAALQAQMAKLSGASRSFTLKRNQSEVLAPNHIVGMAGITPSTVTVMFENEQKSISVGITLYTKFDGKDCGMTLRGMDYMLERGEFQWACWNSANP